MVAEDLGGRLLGQVAWDGSMATSERVLLRATVANRRLVERNRYVRILDEDGVRSGFLGRVITGPFFHRCGTATVAGMTASPSLETFLLAELEIQGELVEGRPRGNQRRPRSGRVLAIRPDRRRDVRRGAPREEPRVDPAVEFG